MTDNEIIALLAKMTRDVIPIKRSRIAAAIAHRGNIISLGSNQRKSHPFQKKYAKNEHAIYMHAEISSIISALREIPPLDLCKTDIYVARTYADGSYALARPCPGCMKAIKAFDMKRMIYTTGKSAYTCEAV